MRSDLRGENLLNSRSEYSRCKVPRLTVDLEGWTNCKKLEKLTGWGEVSTHLEEISSLQEYLSSQQEELTSLQEEFQPQMNEPTPQEDVQFKLKETKHTNIKEGAL